MVHQEGCVCGSCSGVVAWKHLLGVSLPAHPHRSATSAAVPPPALGFHQSKLQFLSRWIIPHKSEVVSHGSVDITLDAILQGQTKSPITYQDLRRFLRNMSDDGLNLAALDFLVAFLKYQEGFLSLHPSERPPHPYTVIEYLSLLEGTKSCDKPLPPIDSASSPTSGPISVSPTSPVPLAGLLGCRSRSRGGTVGSSGHSHSDSGRITRPRAATLQVQVQSTTVTSSRRDSFINSLVFDPSAQPLRVELDLITHRFLGGSISQPLTTLIPSDITARALSEVKLTTHPSTLQPIATFLHNHLANATLPAFLDDAVINLSRTTSVGRMLAAFFVFATALALTVVFIQFETSIPRPARLALLPFYLISIGYAIGSRTSLCFWLAWRGTRETKPLEDEEQAIAAEREFRANGANHDRFASSDNKQSKKLKREARHGSDLSRALSSNSNGSNDNYRLSVYTINTYSNEVKGLLPSPRSPGFGKSQFHKPGDRAYLSFNPLMIARRRNWSWDRMLRLTGTARNTVKVEDESIRKMQTRIAVKVTVWLALGTISVMTVVMVIP